MTNPDQERALFEEYWLTQFDEREYGRTNLEWLGDKQRYPVMSEKQCAWVDWQAARKDLLLIEVNLTDLHNKTLEEWESLKAKTDELISAIHKFNKHCNTEEKGWYSDGVAGLVQAVSRIQK